MTNPHRHSGLIIFLATLCFGPLAGAYGGGGSSSCEDPKFLKAVPADNASVPSLAAFSFLASETDADTLIVQIDGETVPATINPMRNGDLQVAVTPPAPITKPGKVRITAQGKSKDGCAGFAAFYIEIKP